jgi:sec-independent protein translocase protein TatB
MFGMDVSELMVLLVVGIVVVGPKRLPELMRKAGTYIAKLRRLSTNLRAQSGIDRILREEGLDKEIRELRALKESLSKQAMLDGLVNAVNRPPPARPQPARPLPPASAAPKTAPALGPPAEAAADASKPVDAAAEGTTQKTSTEGQPPGAPEAPATASAGAEEKPASPAAALIKPAEGTVARGEPVPARPEPMVKNAFRSVREREYPAYGPDHYEALPDDLEEDDPEQAAAEPVPTASEAAS